MKIFFVVGPTGSGKSQYALQRAQSCEGVIVNCDSIQQYAHLKIGAALPSEEDFDRVQHYLYSYVQPPNENTVGDYHRDFFSLLDKLNSEGVENVFVVGGTGFYFQAIEKGLFPVGKSNSHTIEQLELVAEKPEGLWELYLELKKIDPESAEKIHPNDAYRVVRAIEIWRRTLMKPSVVANLHRSQQSPFPYPLEKIGIHWERSELHTRIEMRIHEMLKSGLIQEVENLLHMGLATWAPLQSVGYKEVQLYLNGNLGSKTILEQKILFSTRQLAKRQLTWFRRDLSIQWLSGSQISN